MGKLVKLLLLAVLTVTTVLLLSACGGGTGEDEGSVFEELLGTVPDTPDTRSFVLLIDHAREWKTFDYPICLRPGPVDGYETVEECFEDVDLPPVEDASLQLQGPFIRGADF